MGNSASSSNSQSEKKQENDFNDLNLSILPSKEIKFRDGNVAGAIPAPGSEATYTLKIQRDQFKSHLFKNLDNNYLIASLMNEYAVDEVVLTQGINSVRKLDGEQKSQITDEVKDFEECIAAGVNIDLSESLEVCEKELCVFGEVNASPFLLSFQRRLALLISVRSFLVNDKNKAHQQYMPRVYSISSQDLSSAIFPELDLLENLTNSGISVLDIFHACYPLIDQHGSEDIKNAIIQPVRKMCDDMSKLTDLQLYQSQLPAEPVKVTIVLNTTSVSCTNGMGNLAVDGKLTTAWSTNKTRASWSIEFEEPARLSAIKVSWVPGTAGFSGLVNTGVGAPRRVIISVMYANEQEEGKEKDVKSNKYEFVSTVLPDSEYFKQGSWKQTYSLFKDKNDDSSRKVLGVKLSISRRATANLSNTLKLYSFEAFAHDNEIKKLKILDVMVSLASSLFTVITYDHIRDNALSALISLIRSSGSLKIVLIFVNHVFEMLQSLDSNDSGNFGHQTLPFDDLFAAIENENDSIMRRLTASTLTIQNDVFFSSTLKSNGGIDIIEDGLCVTSASGASNSTRVYNLLTTVMSSGVWAWEFTIMHDVVDSNLSGVGVAMPSITAADYESSPDMYIVQFSTGKIFHGGVVEGMPQMHVPRFRKNDICAFCYNADVSTLSLRVNGRDYGVIFEGIPKGFSPIVILVGGRKSVRLGKVHYKAPVIVNEDSKENSPVRPKEMSSSGFDSLTESVNAEENSSNIGMLASASKLLSKISKLANSRIKELDIDESGAEMDLLKTTEMQSNSLEYPFCVSVSIDSIMLLVDLLKKCRGIGLQKGKSNVLSILHIMDAQFLCLAKSQIDPAEVGFSIEKNEENSSSKLIASAADVLLSYAKDKDEDIRVAAARVYARGSSIFLPTVWNKIELVLKLVQDSNLGNSPRSTTPWNIVGESDNDETIMIILEIIVSRLSSLNNVLEVIDMLKTSDDAFREKVAIFLSYLLNNASKKIAGSLSSDSSKHQLSDFYQSSVLLLARFQETLILEITGINDSSKTVTPRSKQLSSNLAEVLFSYFSTLSSSCVSILRIATQAHNQNKHDLARSEVEEKLRESILASLLQPLVHSLVFCAHDLHVCEGLLPTCLQLLQELSNVVRESETCQQAQKLLCSQLQRQNPLQQMQGNIGSSRSSGWQVINAIFEDHGSFDSGDDNSMYISTTSGNTCGILNCSFSGNDKAAWEWELIHDTRDDECSIFGIARKPLTSRCYSSSTDLWVRRSYNGYMYAQGRTIRTTMEKIHQGDIVRCEYDGQAGTLTYSVNGSDPIVGFTDLTDEIWPACGSYRSDVRVKLLKVEQYKTPSTGDAVVTSPLNVDWKLEEDYRNKRDPNILCCPSGDIDVTITPCVTARGDTGAAAGVHEWTYEILERSLSKYAIGVVFGSADVPINTYLGQQPSTSNAAVGKEGCSMAWHTDGTLWWNGKECADNFGMSALPLGRLSSVTIRLDFNEQTLSYFVNGEKIGKAFGPEGCGAAVSAYFPWLPQKNYVEHIEPACLVYPAASISSSTQKILLKPTGFYGSITVPLEVTLQKATASVFGRLVASVLKGIPIDQEENSLLPWLQSPLFIGGIESLAEASESFLSETIDEKTNLEWEVEWSQKRSGLAPVPSSEEEMSEHKDEEREQFLNILSQPELNEIGEGFMNWLEKINPEPAFLQQAFRAGGYYSFPRCEMPYLVALLGHGGLEKEAIKVCSLIQKAINSGDAEADNTSLPSPSSDMVKLWKGVSQLRQFLRKRRQEFKAQPSIIPNPDTTSSSTIESTLLDAPATARDSETGTDVVPTLSIETSTPDVINNPVDRINDSNVHFYGERSQIYWKTQEFETRSVLQDYAEEDEDSYYCEIYETGIDCEEFCIFVSYRMIANNDETMQQSDESTVIVNGIKTTPEILLTDESPNAAAGMMRFDLEIDHFDHVKEAGEIQFCYGPDGEYSTITLILENDIPDSAISGSGAIISPISTDSPTLSRARSSSSKRNAAAKKKKAVDFQDLCERVEERARFLLSFSSVGGASPDDPKSKNKASLHSLLDKYSQDSFAQPQLRRLRSQDGQERWSKVIQFLRAHSNIRKQVSQQNGEGDPPFPLVVPTESTDMAHFSSDWDERSKSVSKKLGGGSSPIRNANSGKGKSRFHNPLEVGIEGRAEFDDSALANEAMVACGLFLTIDDSIASPYNLARVILRRSRRAHQRVYAMQALQSALQLPDIVCDSFCVEQLLLFVRAAMQSPLSTKKKSALDDTLDLSSHYLVNLEGCPSRTLTSVQSSFLSFYSTLSNLIGQYISAWSDSATAMCETTKDDFERPGLSRLGSLDVHAIDAHGHPHITLNVIKLMLSLWVLNYSNRDHRFVMQCGVVPSLYRLLSLSFFEKVAQIGLSASRDLSAYVMELNHKFPEARKWGAWSPDIVRSGLDTGSLSCRSVLLHLQLIPDSVVDTEGRHLLGLTETLDALRRDYGVSQVSLLHSKVSNLIEKRRILDEEAAAEKVKQETEADAKKEAEITARIKNCGVFDVGKIGNALKLAKNSRVVSHPSGRRNTAASAYVDLIYDLSIDMELDADLNAQRIIEKMEESGNYFEVQILKVGTSGNISIGLAKDSGSGSGIINKVVGFETGTYGVRFDTGVKQGSNASEGDFVYEPAEGDIIGCGFDFGAKNIWYTRNGVLLGVAFTGVEEKKLRPVVSFSGMNEGAQSVQINCGIVPFKYTVNEGAPRPYTNKAAFEECNRSKDDDDSANGGGDGEVLANLSVDSTVEEDLKNTDTWKEEQRVYISKIRDMQARCEASGAYEAELLSLRTYASTLMRFILTTTCHSDSDYEKTAALASDSEIPAPLVTPVLMRGVSSYGTPKFITREDGVVLQKGITAAMMQQLILGATYLSNCHVNSACYHSKFAGNASGNSCTLGLEVKSALPMSQTPPTEAAQSIAVTQAIQLDPEQYEGDEDQTRLATMDSTGAQKLSVKPVLEVVEIEGVLYSHLVTLAAIMGSTQSLRKEVSKVKSIAALLQLLRYGSNRIKVTAGAILQKILPGMTPEEVELSLSEELRDQVALATDAQNQVNKRRQRRMPDGLVRFLLFSIRDTLGVGYTQKGGDAFKQLPHGAGQQALLQADQHLSLIQGLFEAPIWTELIACNITDCLRNAGMVLSSINENMEKRTLTCDEEGIILTACAAIGVLCGLGTIRPGVPVVSSDSKALGTLIWSSKVKDEAKVIFETPGMPIVSASTKNIESVKGTSLTLACEGTNVDLARLSQPLLPQMIAILKALLVRHAQDSRTGDSSAMSACLMRLNYLVSTSVSVLMEKQPDMVIDATQDANIVGDIISVALRPTGMKHFPSLANISRMWCQTQGRALERVIESPKPRSNKAVSCTRASSDTGEKSIDSTADVEHDDTRTAMPPANIAETQTEEDGVEAESISLVLGASLAAEPMLSHDAQSREERLGTARRLALETGVHISTCLHHLEFYMADEEVTRRSLQALISEDPNSGNPPAVDWIQDNSSATPSLSRAAGWESEERNDERDHQRLAGILDQASADNDKNFLTSVPGLDSPCYDMDVERIVRRSAGESDTMPSGPVLTEKSYVVELGEEGPLPRNAAFGRIGTRCQIADDKSDEGNTILLNFYDHSKGMDLYDILDVENVRVVRCFFDHPTSSPAQQQIPLLDRAGFILRMRKIAAKLMLENSLNLVQDAVKVDDWLSLLKLTTATSVDSFASASSNRTPGEVQEIFKSMCGSLLSRARSYSSVSLDVGMVVNVPNVGQIKMEGESEDNLPSVPTPLTLRMPPPPEDLKRENMVSLGPANRVESEVVSALIDDMKQSFSSLAAGFDLPIGTTSGPDKPYLSRMNCGAGSQSLRTARSHSGSITAHGVDSHSIEAEELMFCSPHPFTAPCTTSGRIELPSNWFGAIIKFHPKCCTPSALAALKIYVSESDFTEDVPKYTFAGNSTQESVKFGGSSVSPFPKSLPISDTTCLYYRFECSVAGGDKPPMVLLPSRGSLKVDDDGYISKPKVEDTTPIGLGEEDTLANLFNVKDKEVADPTNIIALCDMVPVDSGGWYFEVDIISVPNHENMSVEEKRLAVHETDAVRIGMVGSKYIDATSAEVPEILGVDKNSLGYSSNGFICSQGDLVGTPDESYKWEADDCIGCFFYLHPKTGRCTATYSRNGTWFKTAPATLVHDADARYRVRPVISLSNNSVKIRPNFGERKFYHSDTIETLINSDDSMYKGVEWKPLLARPMEAQNGCMEIGQKATPDGEEIKEKVEDSNSWGYQFIVRPLKDLIMNITRKFKLIAKLPGPKVKGFEASGSESSKGLWIWNPVLNTGPEDTLCPQRSVCDIATNDPRQPRGSMVVDLSQCLLPTGFVKIAEFSAEGVTIYRPTHENKEYVSMGDIAIKSSGSPTPEGLGLRCPVLVPKWSVTEGPLGRKLFDSKKVTNSDKMSIWSARNGLGSFFASPCSGRIDFKGGRKTKNPKWSSLSVGTSYSFNTKISNMLSGEWANEEDALQLASACWATDVLEFLLNHPRTQEKVLRPSIFLIIVDFIQSPSAPAPLTAVPSLIKMIRGAQEKDINLPLSQIDALCKAILHRATQIGSTSSSSFQLSDDMLKLVDLVVEVQSAQVSKNTREEFKQWVAYRSGVIDNAYLSGHELAAQRANSSTSFGTYLDIVRKSLDRGHIEYSGPTPQPAGANIADSRFYVDRGMQVNSINHVWNPAPVGYVVPEKTYRPWWLDHNVLFDDVERQFLCKKDRLQDIFAKDVLTRKLKQALGFLAALGAGVDSSQRDAEMHLFGEEFKPTFPKILLSRIWYEFASLSAFMESEHPFVVPEGEALEDFNPNKGSATKKYAMNRKYLPVAGLYVRRTHSLSAEPVGCLKWDSFPGDCVEVMEEKLGWVKLAPSMYEKIKKLRDFKEHDPITEGWCLIRSGEKSFLDLVEYEVQRRVSFPGATSLNVYLDRRIALGAGTLVFQTPTESKTVDCITLADHTKADVLKVEKSLTFTGPELVVSYRMISTREAKESNKTEDKKVEGREEKKKEVEYVHKPPANDAGHWGWAFTVVASNDCYESAEACVEVERKRSVANNDLFFCLTPQERLDIVQNFTQDLQVLKALRDETGEAEKVREDKKASKETERYDIAQNNEKAECLKTSPDKKNSGKEGAVSVTDFLVQKQEQFVSSFDVSLPGGDEIKKSAAEDATDKPKHVKDPAEGAAFVFHAGEGKHEKADKKSKNKKKISAPSPEEAMDRIQKLSDKLGLQYQTGTLKLPHASSTDVTVERPKFEQENCQRSVIVFLELPGVSEPKVISFTDLNTPNPEKIKVSGNSLKYHMLIVGHKDEEPEQESLQIAEIEEENGKAEPGEGWKLSDSDNAPEMNRAVSTFSEHMGDVWACAVCTLLNPTGTLNCTVCGYAAPEDIGATPAGGGAAESAGWWCSTCTYINTLGNNTCQMCENAQEGMEGEAASEIAEGAEPEVEKSKKSAKAASKSDVYSVQRDVVILSMRAKLTNEAKFQTRVEAAMASEGIICTPKVMKDRLAAWTPAADNIILEYLNSISNEVEGNTFFSNPGNLALPKKFLQYKYSAILKDFTIVDIQTRILLLESFNKSLEELLPLINLRNSDVQSIGAMLRKCSKYVFLSTKVPILEKVISSTAASSGPGLPASLLLNNNTAMSSRDKNEFDPSNSQCVFVQAFTQLKDKDSIAYKYLFAVDRVFQINYVGESGIDAGGVFREGISAMCQDLFSDHFNLFILCPNGQHETHMNCEKFVPNPTHTTPLALQMFEFVGKLMACSLRAKLMLPFEFPSMVWKLLCGEELTLADLSAMDAISCQLLEALRKCDEDGIINQETFFAKYSDTLRWTYNGSDGVERELYKGSDSRVVTYENKDEFCDRMENARMNEFSEQVAAMSKGFEAVIPERVVKLFSWDQLEVLVCGNPIIDIALWKQQSSSTGLSTRTVAWFWKVMESLSNKEQSAFIRFAWGRSRLPPLKEFTTKMRLTSGSGRLPVAHTCFFSVELPEYETEDEMRHGLLTAIHFGVGGVLVS